MNQSADTNYGRKQRMAKRKQTPNWCDNVTAIGSIDSPRDGMPLGKLASMRALRNVERPDRPWMTDSERLILVNSQNAWKLDLLELFEVAASASGGRHRWVLVTDQPERLAKAYADWRARGKKWPSSLWPGVRLQKQRDTKKLDAILRLPAEMHVALCELRERLDLSEFVRVLYACPQESGKPHEHHLKELRDCCSQSCREETAMPVRAAVGWVIASGEGGPYAAACAQEWLSDLAKQLERPASICFFLQQMGSFSVSEGRTDRGRWAWRAGLHTPNGDGLVDIPEQLRIREIPARSQWEWTRMGRRAKKGATDDIPF